VPPSQFNGTIASKNSNLNPNDKRQKAMRTKNQQTRETTSNGERSKRACENPSEELNKGVFVPIFRHSLTTLSCQHTHSALTQLFYRDCPLLCSISHSHNLFSDNPSTRPLLHRSPPEYTPCVNRVRCTNH